MRAGTLIIRRALSNGPIHRVSRVSSPRSMAEGSGFRASSPGTSGDAGGKGVTGIVDLHPHGRSSAPDLTDRVHLLPCSIKHDGPCSVSHYFKPKRTDVVVDGLCVEEAFFRGRKLQGVTVPIPQGYRGYVLGKKKWNGGNSSETPEDWVSQWVSCAEFGNLTYWNHDSLPSPDDPLLRCFHWFSVANAEAIELRRRYDSTIKCQNVMNKYSIVSSGSCRVSSLRYRPWLRPHGYTTSFISMHVFTESAGYAWTVLHMPITPEEMTSSTPGQSRND